MVLSNPSTKCTLGINSLTKRNYPALGHMSSSRPLSSTYHPRIPSTVRMQTDWTPPRGPVPTDTLTNALTTLHSHSRGVPTSAKHVQTMLPTVRHQCQITRPHLPQYFRHYLDLRRTALQRARTISGLEQFWDAPLSGTGTHRPRAGTHECTWNRPGTHH